MSGLNCCQLAGFFVLFICLFADVLVCSLMILLHAFYVTLLFPPGFCEWSQELRFPFFCGILFYAIFSFLFLLVSHPLKWFYYNHLDTSFQFGCKALIWILLIFLLVQSSLQALMHFQAILELDVLLELIVNVSCHIFLICKVD